MRKSRKDLKYTRNMTPTLKELDVLWSKVIKLRAGMKSEYKHIEGSYLVAHHITGKNTLARRYALENGVCITTGQHHYVAHNTGRSAKFKAWALAKRGVTEEYLDIISRNTVDKFAVKLYLEQKIKEYEADL